MSKKKVSDLLFSLILIAPAFTIFGVFLLYPTIQSIYFSFYSWVGIRDIPMVFVGLDNFRVIFSNARFFLSIRNAGIFMLGGFLVLMPLAFFLASIIVSKIRAAAFFRTTFFIPMVLPITAIALIWTHMLHPTGGVVNHLLQVIGIHTNQNWLGNTSIAIYVVVLVNAWIFAGFNMLIFATGMSNIPDVLYEAARIDGAIGWQRLIYITLPSMKESFKIFTVLCFTGCLRTFDLVFVMTGGGPAHSTEVPATLLYNEAFRALNFGNGNAIAAFILAAGLILSIGTNQVLKSRD